MEDWRDKLGALKGLYPADEQTDSELPAENEPTDEASPTLPRKQQKLRLGMERAGRGGKTITLIRGFVGTDDEIHALCKMLKQRCGVGGSAKEGEIIIQGDHRTRLVELLKQEGYTQTK